MCIKPLENRNVPVEKSDDDNEIKMTMVTQENINKTMSDTSSSEIDINVRYGALSLACLVAGMSITFPHIQTLRDELECDTLCYGAMTSARSMLSLCGSAVVGRMSDGANMGRKRCLLIGIGATLVGLIISLMTHSIEGLWLAIVPGALLEQNFGVLKALFADYHHENNIEENESKKITSNAPLTNSVGKLGMSVGLAFMVGPLFGGTLVKNYNQALLIAIIMTMISGMFISKLVDPPVIILSNKKMNKTGFVDRIKKFINVPSAKSPACIFLIIVRVLMALAFHIFSTIWTVSLKKRFDFQPSDHGKFMSFIGLTYALSQGFVANRVINIFGPNRRVQVLLLCCVALGVGRYCAFQTTNLMLVYFMFLFIVMALGIVNTVISADTGKLAPTSEIGGVFGILEAMQNAAGMFGPLLGGSLAKMSSDAVTAPLISVLAIYFIVFMMIMFGYQTYVLDFNMKKWQTKTKEV